MPPIGLYVHIPFCASRCDYCDFFVVIEPRRTGGFFETLQLDLAAQLKHLQEESPVADTIYLGGGTPSLVEGQEIARLLEGCRELLSVDAEAEITLEANPEGITLDKARAWREAGVNRLSVGIQSFNDDVLKPRGRHYSGVQAVAAFNSAREAGFPHLSIDLIAGLPGESVTGFLEGVDRAAELGADHLSVYLLETSDSLKESHLASVIDSGGLPPPDETTLVEMYTGTVDRLRSSGFQQYEISNFCREGGASRHNLKYWETTPWIGIGPSAHSFIDERRTAWPAGLEEWRGRVESGKPPDDVTLDSAGAQAREALVLQLRLTAGIDLDEFSGRWGFDPRLELGGDLEELGRAGLLDLHDGRLFLTRQGILLSNEVFGRIV